MKSEQEKEYKFLIFTFTIDGSIGVTESYANEDHLIKMGLDPLKDMDVRININGYNIASINLEGKFRDKYQLYIRDLSIRKIFNEL